MDFATERWVSYPRRNAELTVNTDPSCIVQPAWLLVSRLHHLGKFAGICKHSIDLSITGMYIQRQREIYQAPAEIILTFS